jgi:hypothetical protein
LRDNLILTGLDFFHIPMSGKDAPGKEVGMRMREIHSEATRKSSYIVSKSQQDGQVAMNK